MEQEVGTLAPHASAQIVSGWARIRGRLREEVGDSEYRSWLRQMTLHGVDGDEVVILLPTRFMRDWVNGHYGDRLRALWQAECPTVRRVDIRVSQGAASAGAAEGTGIAIGTPDDVVDLNAGVERGLAESLASRPAEARATMGAGTGSGGAEPRSDWVAPLEG